MMIREQIRNDIEKQVSGMVGKWAIGSEAQARRDGRVEVTRTSDAEFGDYTSNVALKVAPVYSSSDSEKSKKSSSRGARTIGQIKQSPFEFARVLADSLRNQPYVEKLEVAGPGFVNFWIKDEVWQEEVGGVLTAGNKYGANQIGKNKKARVEFVSANPTGPLHFGNARGGPIGDVLANVLEFYGYKVVREYYHNDVGEQVRKLGESIVNVAAGQKLEDQEYKGEYVRELVKRIGIKINAPGALMVGARAVAILLEEILKDCSDMGIQFDKVYAESDFVTTGGTEKVLKALKRKGILRDKDGALWFAPSDEFLKDRETVVIKSDGSYTYFANDIAYHDLKFADNPDLVIDVLGANHHGHVPRLQAVIKALGYDVAKFHVILYQWVRFRRGGQSVAMSKRAGTYVTAREVLDEVGRDALRFFILMHDPNTHIDFDLELAKKKSSDNPVYYVQYAVARISSILAKSKVKSQKSKVDYRLLTTNFELDLIKQITRLPELVEDIASNFAVHRLTGYATDLADSFHRFYENCRVIGESRELELARLDLILATKITLVNTLKLLGISAPQKM